MGEHQTADTADEAVTRAVDRMMRANEWEDPANIMIVEVLFGHHDGVFCNDSVVPGGETGWEPGSVDT